MADYTYNQTLLWNTVNAICVSFSWKIICMWLLLVTCTTPAEMCQVLLHSQKNTVKIYYMNNTYIISLFLIYCVFHQLHCQYIQFYWGFLVYGSNWVSYLYLHDILYCYSILMTSYSILTKIIALRKLSNICLRLSIMNWCSSFLFNSL